MIGRSGDYSTLRQYAIQTATSSHWPRRPRDHIRGRDCLGAAGLYCALVAASYRDGRQRAQHRGLYTFVIQLFESKKEYGTTITPDAQGHLQSEYVVRTRVIGPCVPRQQP